MSTTRTILTGLCFGEGPRWHQGAVWFSDIHARRVVRAELDGTARTVARLPNDLPSGLGWLPDGRLLIVAMNSRKLLRLQPDGALAEHADLSHLARGVINDMIVAADGTAYVGDMGFGSIGEPASRRGPGQTIRVDPNGTVSCAASDLHGPNGHLLSEDGRRLIVAESRGACLTSFDVRHDGSLTGRRTFARIPPDAGTEASIPDGICLDAEGAVWVAEVTGRRLLRVHEGGEITECIRYDVGTPIAPVLGGPDRRTLIICAAVEFRGHGATRVGNAWLDTHDVPVSGAGRP